MKKSRNIFQDFSLIKIFTIFAALSFFLRVVFFVWQSKDIAFSATLLIQAFAVGIFFDLLAFSYILAIPLLYYTFLPTKIFQKKSHQNFLKILYFTFLFVIIFSAFAEVIFWEEFQTRFNFIAVDYLIYTTEVIKNIVESYPIGLLLSVIFLLSFAVFYFTKEKIFVKKSENFPLRVKNFTIFAILLSLAFVKVDSSKLTEISDNNYANEISANGIYQLFSAYRNNQINYSQLYPVIDSADGLKRLRALIAKQEPSSKFLNEEDISRIIFGKSGGEKKYNVMLISIESMSAEFMSAFGNKENITPNLDEFAKKGLFFTKLKATGTRTVRGLEALSLSVPPTPGNSILRRQNNENLFNIASPLKDRGYDARFVYGGFGYFDNMNYFFENNGFEIVDRDKFSKNEISFENAWGVSDEDLFDKAIAQADKSVAQGRHFINFVMTTSNHRPFTYPDGKIDIDSKTGRNGAVKYTDYAIGQLVKKAKEKKWFDDTIFIFVADHCAGSAGNTDVPLWRYQIPAIFYAPKIIKPRIFDKNVSQIDIAPTLLGMMNLSYKSKFFGSDVLSNEKNIDHHSFVSTYSDVGYFKDSKLYLLKPKKEKKVFDVEISGYGYNASKEVRTEEYSEEELENAIAYYQVASQFFKDGKMKKFGYEGRR